MISTNEALTGEKIDQVICCTKCDFTIQYIQKTKWYVERQLEFLKSLPWALGAPCQHELEIQEQLD